LKTENITRKVLKIDDIYTKDIATESIAQSKTKETHAVKNSNSIKHQNESVSKIKMILYFNPFFDQEDYYFGFGNEKFAHLCEVSNCYTTNNRSILG
jgi:hypothetical protein